MPRKKKLDETTSDPIPAVESALEKEKKPRAPSRKKSGANVTLEELPPPDPVVLEKPAPTKPSRPKKKAEPVAETPTPEPTKRSRSRKTPVVEPVAMPEPEVPKDVQEELLGNEPPTAAASPDRKRSLRPSKKAPPEPILEEESTTEEGNLWGEDLPIPIWRPRRPIPATAATETEEPETELPEEDVELEDRGRKRRNRRRRGAKPVEEVQAVEPTPEPVKEPKARKPHPREPKPKLELAPPVVVAPPRPEIRVPKRPIIEVPEDAPQVVLRNNIPTLVRNHRVYPPFFFFGSPADERRANTVLEEMAMAAEAGVHLHSFLIDFNVDKAAVDGAVALAAYVLSKAVQTDPKLK